MIHILSEKIGPYSSTAFDTLPTILGVFFSSQRTDLTILLFSGKSVVFTCKYISYAIFSNNFSSRSCSFLAYISSVK